ncbi:hypothetical protein [Shouchella clausii]|uniref:hypothetical protein n=1 Tax=Shouchella clausii TaxID=79880 RepID=UPI001C73DA25|nr:hypothetical protein [Shouchella clausii]MBX0320196.1 hypothetical protein [Shouchella clausii]MEB5480789.1 hypothetical protein [Shouchella clausii]
MDFMPAHGTTLIADVFDMLVIDPKGYVLLEDKLTSGNISGQTESNDVRAGQGNNLFAVLHNSKEIEITQNSPVFNFKSLAMHIGSDITTGKGIGYAAAESHIVSNGKITLKKEPISQSSVKIENEHGIQLNDFTLSEKEITFEDLADGEKVRVLTYEYETPEHSQTIFIPANEFPENVKIVLTTLEISRGEQPLNYIQFVFDLVKPSANFTIETSSERQAATRENTFRVLKPEGEKYLGKVHRFPIDENPTP